MGGVDSLWYEVVTQCTRKHIAALFLPCTLGNTDAAPVVQGSTSWHVGWIPQVSDMEPYPKILALKTRLWEVGNPGPSFAAWALANTHFKSLDIGSCLIHIKERRAFNEPFESVTLTPFLAFPPNCPASPSSFTFPNGSIPWLRCVAGCPNWPVIATIEQTRGLALQMLQGTAVILIFSLWGESKPIYFTNCWRNSEICGWGKEREGWKHLPAYGERASGSLS